MENQNKQRSLDKNETAKQGISNTVGQKQSCVLNIH